MPMTKCSGFFASVNVRKQLTTLYWYIRIIRVPFTGSVKLRALLLKAGPGEQTPAKIALVR